MAGRVAPLPMNRDIQINIPENPNNTNHTIRHPACITFVCFILFFPLMAGLTFGLAISFSTFLSACCSISTPEFRVKDISLTKFNASSNSTTIDARFIVGNPSTVKTLYYDEINATMFYKSDKISETSLQPFVQRGSDHEAELNATLGFLKPSDYDQGMMFHVKIMVKGRCKTFIGWSKQYILNKDCPAISLPISFANVSLLGFFKEYCKDVLL